MRTLVIGSGPAALIAADKIAGEGQAVDIFEKRSGPGRKLLIAGSSGLNVSYEAGDLAAFYPERRAEVSACLTRFGKADWLEYLHGLGLETFLGSSRRHFLKSMKASPLVRAWVKRLEGKGVRFHYGEELLDFHAKDGSATACFRSGREEKADALLLALGGGSYEDEAPRWVEMLLAKGVDVKPLAPSNAGFHLEAPPEFFAAAEGKPLKGVVLRTARGEKAGELMITRYGLEGTPVYTVGCRGPATLDLKPDLTEEKLRARLQEARGTPWRRVERAAKLSEGALALAQHLGERGFWESVESAARALKRFPVQFLESRPLGESISSRGGVSWDELTPDLELRKCPHVFCAGEMIDWDAPTGGFLIQTAVATGFVAAEGILRS